MVPTTIYKKDKAVEETRFYISSLLANARQLKHTARAHWGIESQLHWRLFLMKMALVFEVIMLPKILISCVNVLLMRCKKWIENLISH